DVRKGRRALSPCVQNNDILLGSIYDTDRIICQQARKSTGSCEYIRLAFLRDHTGNFSSRFLRKKSWWTGSLLGCGLVGNLRNRNLEDGHYCLFMAQPNRLRIGHPIWLSIAVFFPRQ